MSTPRFSTSAQTPQPPLTSTNNNTNENEDETIEEITLSHTPPRHILENLTLITFFLSSQIAAKLELEFGRRVRRVWRSMRRRRVSGSDHENDDGDNSGNRGRDTIIDTDIESGVTSRRRNANIDADANSNANTNTNDDDISVETAPLIPQRFRTQVEIATHDILHQPPYLFNHIGRFKSSKTAILFGLWLVTVWYMLVNSSSGLPHEIEVVAVKQGENVALIGENENGLTEVKETVKEKVKREERKGKVVRDVTKPY